MIPRWCNTLFKYKLHILILFYQLSLIYLLGFGSWPALCNHLSMIWTTQWHNSIHCFLWELFRDVGKFCECLSTSWISNHNLFSSHSQQLLSMCSIWKINIEKRTFNLKITKKFPIFTGQVKLKFSPSFPVIPIILWLLSDPSAFV